MSWMSSLSNLTHEQARALLPLLQSIAYDSPPESSPFLHCDSSPGEQFQMDEEVYSLKELLAKKKNNSMSTEL